MAFDEAKIYVRSGDGGDGMISFRREKYIPRGGPSGGDGGDGGDVILRVNPKISTLAYFQKKVHFRADHGKRGGSSRKTGASAESLIIQIPPGTVVRHADTEAVLADLVQPDAEYTVLKGGRGGRGNARFASAPNSLNNRRAKSFSPKSFCPKAQINPSMATSPSSQIAAKARSTVQGSSSNVL